MTTKPQFSACKGYHDNPGKNRDEKEGYGINIYVGPSPNTIQKEITLPYTNMLVIPIPRNPMKEDWTDHFEVEVQGKKLIVRRTDKPNGWGMHLLLRGYYNKDDSASSHRHMFKAVITNHTLTVELIPNQILRSHGNLIFAGPGVQANKAFMMVVPQSTAEKSFLMSRMQNISTGLKRLTVDKKIPVVDYSYNAEKATSAGTATSGTVVLGVKMGISANIIHLALGEFGNRIFCRRGSFIASSLDVQILDSDFFGKLQTAVGHGDLFLRARGAIEQIELKDSELIEVETDSLIAMTQEVQTDPPVILDNDSKRTLLGPGIIWKTKYSSLDAEDSLRLSLNEKKEVIQS
jgi:uncharacterized protein (AIM24 family)